MKALAKEQVKILKHTISANEKRIKKLEALIGKLYSNKINQDFSIRNGSEIFTFTPDKSIASSKGFEDDLKTTLNGALGYSERSYVSKNEEKVSDDKSVTDTTQDLFLPTVKITEKKEIATVLGQDKKLFLQEDNNQVGTSNTKAFHGLIEEVKNSSEQGDWNVIEKIELLNVQSNDPDPVDSNDKYEMPETYTKISGDNNKQKLTEGRFSDCNQSKIGCDSTDDVITDTKACREIPFMDSETVDISSNFDDDRTERNEILLQDKSVCSVTNIEMSHDDGGNKIIDEPKNEHQVTHEVSHNNADDPSVDSNDELSDIDEEAVRREVEERIRREIEIRVRKEIEERRRKRKSVKSMIE